MAKPKQKRFRCGRCNRYFKTYRGLEQHKRLAHPEKFRGLVNYLSLLDNSPWARVFENEKDLKAFKKNPDDKSLMLAVMFRVLEILNEIKYELKRERRVR